MSDFDTNTNFGVTDANWEPGHELGDIDGEQRRPSLPEIAFGIGLTLASLGGGVTAYQAHEHAVEAAYQDGKEAGFNQALDAVCEPPYHRRPIFIDMSQAAASPAEQWSRQEALNLLGDAAERARAASDPDAADTAAQLRHYNSGHGTSVQPGSLADECH